VSRSRSCPRYFRGRGQHRAAAARRRPMPRPACYAAATAAAADGSDVSPHLGRLQVSTRADTTTAGRRSQAPPTTPS